MRKRKMIAALWLAAAVFMMSGCGAAAEPKADNEDYTIGVVTKSKSSEYWMTVCSGMEKAAKDFGVSVTIVSPDTESEDDIQKKMIQDLLDKGVDALAVSPIQSYDSGSYVSQAREAGIPVVAYDTRIADQEVPYIGIDNEKAGRDLACYMAERLGNHGKVGIISGDLNQSAHKDRLLGFRGYIEDRTQIEVAFQESGYGNLQMSEREISRLMEENPGIDGIFATSAVTALGIMEYMQTRPVEIVTVDAQADAIEAVKNDGISALAAQSGYEIGYETIRYLVDLKNGKDREQEQIIEVEIVTKKNVDSKNKTTK